MKTSEQLHKNCP